MNRSTFTFTDHDDISIFVYKWTPDGSPKGVVQIAHGMAEHAARYDRPAEALVAGGYAVYASDHRGHGKSALGPDKLGQLGPGGWQSMLKDMRQLSDNILKENPGQPLFLLGHSMGSFLTQQYLQQDATELKGAVLSGTNGRQSVISLWIARMIANRAAKKEGPDAPGTALDKMVFGAYNKSFAPAKTKFDWLSRDAAEVQKYVDDPLCGFVCSNGFFVDMFTALSTLGKSANEARIRKDLPIYLFSGTRDPVGLNGGGVTDLYDRYRRQNIRDLTINLYPEGRHEMFNEINRNEVYRDLVQWLDAHLE
jgi:alpha-beta hydrolase superfamily lysophospholipase